ncbi:MAG: T9SS type A sorting domain-containing protein [Bacteroidetes bacterium]|nr:T9SS type A sorting domain-containing protein [Bacteroidota bacterium]
MRTLVVLSLLGSCTFTALHAQDGYPDPSFSGDGQVVYDDNGHDESGVAIAVRSDGKIWVLANSYEATMHVLLMRFNNDGGLDNSFFGDGTVELSQGLGNTFSTCMELQADGALLIGGYYIDELGYTAPMVIKVDANGNPVPGFGTGGYALGTSEGYRVTDLGVQSTGTIVVTLGPLATINPAVCTVSGSGVFGVPIPQLQCSLNDRLTALQVQDDDRVLVTGYCGTDNGSNWRALILALNPDLSGDITFSPGHICGQLNIETQGVEYYDSGNPLFYTNDTGNDIAVLGNGDILVAGTTIDTTGNADVYRSSLLKAHEDNSVDASFGPFGWVKPYVGSFFKSLLVQGNKILAVGGTHNATLALARFNTDGTLDLTFGDLGGSTLLAVGSFSTNPGSMAVQPDGRILVVGTAVNNNNDVLVARFNGSVVGVDELAVVPSALVYPNPSSGGFMVSVPRGTTELTLSDALGHVVQRRRLTNEGALWLDVPTPGVYQVNLQGASAYQVARAVVD